MCPTCFSRLDDRALVAALRLGEPEAFAEVHRRYAARLERFAARMVAGRTPGPEDVVQEVFLRAYAALRTDPRPVDLRPWLFRMVRNRCIDELRRTVASTMGEAVPAVPDPLGEPHEVLLRRQAVRDVVTAVNGLPDRQRRALVEHALEGRSQIEVAHRLGTTPKGAKSLVHRARRAVAQAA